MKKVKDYKCPKCGVPHYDNEDGYHVDNIEYPKITNERKGYTSYGDYYDWDEYHKCQVCGEEYWFENGAF